MFNTMRTGIVAAVVGLTLGCGASTPGGPTPVPVVPATVTAVPPPRGAYAITAGANSVAAGGHLTVSWTASVGGKLDWIALFRKDEPNTAYGWWEYTYAATSGTLALTAPSLEGQYEFRYLLDDGYEDAARSTVLTVTSQ